MKAMKMEFGLETGDFEAAARFLELFDKYLAEHQEGTRVTLVSAQIDADSETPADHAAAVEAHDETPEPLLDEYLGFAPEEEG